MKSEVKWESVGGEEEEEERCRRSRKSRGALRVWVLVGSTHNSTTENNGGDMGE